MPTKKFKPGESGNKAGRPPGIKDRRVELRELLRPHAADLMQTAVNLALSGDQAALRMCLDRICPTIKATAEPVETGIPTTGSLAEQGQAIFKAAAKGKISSDEASSLMSILAGQIRIEEATNLDNRIKALEERIEKKGGRI
ncbi:MAG: DUF5681 domain-containing protein [Desulfuromonadaceae bacterium]|nr:DUF5681 domain-containing protein [Desulfuromonadaceae bacterium]MDD2856607.1 DUF5681 domain-containing protein [Desulfuromonadaceae bacterium]